MSSADQSTDILEAITHRAVPGGCRLRGTVKSRSDLLHKRGEMRSVQNPGHVFLEVVAKAVRIVVHPAQQTGHGFVGICPVCLPRLDPAAV